MTALVVMCFFPIAIRFLKPWDALVTSLLSGNVLPFLTEKYVQPGFKTTEFDKLRRKNKEETGLFVNEMWE